MQPDGQDHELDALLVEVPLDFKDREVVELSREKIFLAEDERPKKNTEQGYFLPER